MVFISQLIHFAKASSQLSRVMRIERRRSAARQPVGPGWNSEARSSRDAAQYMSVMPIVLTNTKAPKARLSVS